MFYLLALFCGFLIGFFLAAVLGAGKVSDLEIERAYHQAECVRLRARLALKEMDDKDWEKWINKVHQLGDQAKGEQIKKDFDKRGWSESSWEMAKKYIKLRPEPFEHK